MISLRRVLTFIVLALSLEALAAPLPDDSSTTTSTSTTSSCPSTCKNPRVRKEWRKLKNSEKKAYIDAVKCLQSLPSISDPSLIPGARTRYDDFHAVHITQSKGLLELTGGIHLVGHFLPWHRYFMIAYENALRNECGYTGTQPYWNWALDSGSGKDIRNSPVFDPVTGFGGNGEAGVPVPVTISRPDIPGGTGGGCVLNGPFVNMTLAVGPGESVDYNPRCLSRSINPTIANTYLTSDNLSPLQTADNYGEFRLITEGDQKLGAAPIITFHGAGHYATGGEAGDFISSNAEPLFYLHHTFIDALWLEWQNLDPTGVRFTDISGPQIPFTQDPQVTLDFPISLGVAGAAIPISKVMDVRVGNKGGIGCYVYEW